MEVLGLADAGAAARVSWGMLVARVERTWPVAGRARGACGLGRGSASRVHVGRGQKRTQV